jgi:hypothetical protein
MDLEGLLFPICQVVEYDFEFLKAFLNPLDASAAAEYNLNRMA